ncbi:aliphatic sulfonate ABC transporter substrate-binding protein [Phytohabitans sp. ZYX-F-186]|uniref:Aliphatic sulfonate ABC transporter substrate-binding protein n=1 Tax=Phytohabitans maris TaxID=3071409 RepID=A0ABU0Z9H4_9ACTN|nr:aliphatic sulfonate ABC transporter substrate-binding protein [Phytohabitans sp. ZYX-F-186]MDQ7903694.1 aliphatic sulfonate ABC transporter substrate-binding protein [Phytohabitans sp. ZYX-F-186]
MRHIDRRAFLTGLIAAGVVVGTAACGDDNGDEGSGGDPQTVNVGYIADFNGASLVAVAQEQGLWAKHGLKANLKVFTNGPLQVQALNAGDLDFGYLGPGALWLPASGQAKVIAVNSLGLADRVIAKPGITSVAALKGKTVGVPEGTSGDMILRLALAQAGLTMDDVKKVAMDASTVVTAFGSGQIDAAGIWYPLVGTIKKQVPDLVELAKNEDFPQTSFPTVFVARNEVADTKKDLTAKMAGLIREATDYRAANLDQAIAATVKLTQGPEANFKAEAENVRLLTSAEIDAATADGSVVKWFTGLNELFVSFGKLQTATDPATYYLGDVYTSAK